VAKTTGRRTPADRRFLLPPLAAFDRDELEAHGEYDATDFVDLDFRGQDAADARFLECRLARCSLDGLSLRRARIVESLVEDVHGASVDLADSTWRDARITGGRLGAVTLTGATWSTVRVQGSRFGFVTVAGAHFDDVEFEGCEIGSFDARGAELRRVTFTDCAVEELNVSGATLARVDLSGARLRSLVGVESLRGATISHEQLLDLAPLLAAELGLEVREPEAGGSREGGGS
jgi:uncharacterized protein YjbI with pentapeptide repeats